MIFVELVLVHFCPQYFLGRGHTGHPLDTSPSYFVENITVCFISIALASRWLMIIESSCSGCLCCWRWFRASVVRRWQSHHYYTSSSPQCSHPPSLCLPLPCRYACLYPAGSATKNKIHKNNSQNAHNHSNGHFLGFLSWPTAPQRSR